MAKLTYEEKRKKEKLKFDKENNPSSNFEYIPEPLIFNQCIEQYTGPLPHKVENGVAMFYYTDESEIDSIMNYMNTWADPETGLIPFSYGYKKINESELQNTKYQSFSNSILEEESNDFEAELD